MVNKEFRKIVFIPDYIQQHSSTTAFSLCRVRPDIYEIGIPSTSDWIGYTYFNIDSLKQLKELRFAYPKHKIIVGGIGIYKEYHRIFEYADYIYFGEGYKFNFNSIAMKSMKNIQIQRDFDFSKIPIIQSSKKGWFFQVSRGCPYKCEFCFMSACNNYDKMNRDRVKQAIQYFEKKYLNNYVTLSTNDGMIKVNLKEFFSRNKFNNQYNCSSTPIRILLKYPELYRQFTLHIGIELPTENLRLGHLPKVKQYSDVELLQVINTKTVNSLTLYFIYNYLDSNYLDYKYLLDLLNNNFKKGKKRTLHIDFTTLKIDPFTMLSNRTYEYIKKLYNSHDFFIENKFYPFKITKPRKVVNVAHEMFYTWLPLRYEIPNVKSKESVKSYISRVNDMIEKNGENLENIINETYNDKLGDILELKKL